MLVISKQIEQNIFRPARSPDLTKSDTSIALFTKTRHNMYDMEAKVHIGFLSNFPKLILNFKYSELSNFKNFTFVKIQEFDNLSIFSVLKILEENQNYFFINFYIVNFDILDSSTREIIMNFSSWNISVLKSENSYFF